MIVHNLELCCVVNKIKESSNVNENDTGSKTAEQDHLKENYIKNVNCTQVYWFSSLLTNTRANTRKRPSNLARDGYGQIAVTRGQERGLQETLFPL